MRPTLAYTLLRLLLFFAVALVLALFGVHGITLLVVALVISSIISLPLGAALRQRRWNAGRLAMTWIAFVRWFLVLQAGASPMPS